MSDSTFQKRILSLTVNGVPPVVMYDNPQGAELLRLLGASPHQLAEVSKRVLAKHNEATPNDAKIYPGIAAYHAAVRGLRDVLAPHWEGRHENGLELTVNATKENLRIWPSSGDENTGILERTPQTKNHKGQSTRSAIAWNQMVLSFMERPVLDIDDLVSLIFLYNIDTEKLVMRAELSLPVSINPKTLKISGWSLRIILPTLKFDDHPPLPLDATTPNTEFSIERKNAE